MATFDEVMTALRNADASGNNEDASRLAQIAQRMRSTGGSAGAQTSAPPAPTANVFSGVKQEAEAAVGGLANSLASGRSAVQSHILGNPADDPATSYLRGVGKSFNDAAAATGYDDGTLESAYDKGGIPGAAAHAAKAFVVNAPHAVASYFPPTAALDFASNLQRNAEDRATNDGRTDGPGLTDYAAALPAAGVQELASRFGARALVRPAEKAAEGVVVPGVKAALARIGKATATDATTSAVGSEAQYLGTHVGTQAGATPEGAVSSAMEGGAAGLAGGVGVRSGIEAVNRIPTDRTAARGLKGEAIVAKQGEEQSASDMRVATLAEQVRKQAESGGTLGTSPQDSNAYKTVQNDLIGNLKGTVKRLEDVGDITPEQKLALIGADGGVLDLAKLHNHLFVPEKVDAVVDGLDLEDHVKQGLKDAYRDLNTSTYNSMFKNGTGPLEGFAKKASYPIATAVAEGTGMYMGHPLVGLGAVPLLAKGIQASGKLGDRLLGTNRNAPADASLTALRAAALKRQSLADAAGRDTLGTLRSASDDAVQRQQALADLDRAARSEDAFRKQRDAHTAEAAAKAKLADKLAAKQKAADDAAAKRQATVDKITARQKAREQREEARKRLMGSVDTGAPAMGGFQADVLKSYQDQGVKASLDHLQRAVDNINARGGFSSPEEYQAARNGVRFPNHGDRLSPLFREMDAVLHADGVGATRDSRAETKADAAIVRAKTKALVQAAQPKPAPAAPKERPQAPPRPRSAPRAAPAAVANTNSGGGFPHTAATTAHRARIALEQAVKVAGDRSDLAQMAIHVAGLDTKGAKAQAFAEAVKTFHGDPEASSFVMGPLRTLAHIGGKSEQTANNKAVIRVRSRNKHSQG